MNTLGRQRMCGMSVQRIAGTIALLFVAMVVPACESKARRIIPYYKQASVSRSATAAAMAADWRAQRIKLDDCLNLAFEHLDKEGDGASTEFAGAVLDFAQLVESELPKQAEMELFWTRLGGLAGTAGQKAYEAGDFKGARQLVLAGPVRWQSEAYWRAHPNHDALAAYILYRSGEGAEALRRLRSRADMDPAQQQAYNDIQQAMRENPQPK